jgi:two-component system, chemotaxis family, protein-glutamate methylesterase/glutaminase
MAQDSINNRYELLIIGGSAGSLEVMIRLLPLLQDCVHLAIVVVMHRKAGESLLPELLQGKTSWHVKEAEEKESITNGTIYLAPPDYHLLFEKDKTFSLDCSEKIHYSRPSIDVSFESAADTYGGSVIAVLLSGANADGAQGLDHIRKAGGVAIVQDPSEASVSYMPQQAIDNFEVDYIADSYTIADIVKKLVAG